MNRKWRLHNRRVEDRRIGQQRDRRIKKNKTKKQEPSREDREERKKSGQRKESRRKTRQEETEASKKETGQKQSKPKAAELIGDKPVGRATRSPEGASCSHLSLDEGAKAAEHSSDALIFPPTQKSSNTHMLTVTCNFSSRGSNTIF